MSSYSALWFGVFQPKTWHLCNCNWCLWCSLCQALREGKRCVTAHWLNTVLKRKRMLPPHRTLHLPFAFPPGAKPCSQHVGPTPTNNYSFCPHIHNSHQQGFCYFSCFQADGSVVTISAGIMSPKWTHSSPPL